MANAMTSEPAYQALFLGAGPHMTCGVGQFTRLSQETVEKLEPGSCTSLTLTRSEGSTGDIWRAVGSGASGGVDVVPTASATVACAQRTSASLC